MVGQGWLFIAFNKRQCFIFFCTLQKALVNRPALSVFPPRDWPAKLELTLLNCAPSGMTNVHTMMCGACSIENAIKAALFTKKKKERNSIEFTKLELDTVMYNLPPGCPDLSILSFKVPIFVLKYRLHILDLHQVSILCLIFIAKDSIV